LKFLIMLNKGQNPEYSHLCHSVINLNILKILSYILFALLVAYIEILIFNIFEIIVISMENPVTFYITWLYRQLDFYEP